MIGHQPNYLTALPCLDKGLVFASAKIDSLCRCTTAELAPTCTKHHHPYTYISIYRNELRIYLMHDLPEGRDTQLQSNASYLHDGCIIWEGHQKIVEPLLPNFGSSNTGFWFEAELETSNSKRYIKIVTLIENNNN